MKTKLNRLLGSPIPDSNKFSLDCFPFIFSNEELEILNRKGNILKELAEGRRTPVSSEERAFVKFCKDPKDISSAMVTAWVKYLHRHELEALLLQTEELYQEYCQNRMMKV